MKEKIEVGITGGIGAGKSLICSIISSMGYPVFYSDIEAKKILVSDSELKQQIITLFGTKAYIKNDLNRSFIASKIFGNQLLLEQMNALVHPAVRNAFSKWSKSQSHPIVFNEAAILFETGAYKIYDYTILVTATEETRIERVMKRDAIERTLVENRMSKQWKDSEKIPLADFVIQNNDNDLILPQIINLLNKLL